MTFYCPPFIVLVYTKSSIDIEKSIARYNFIGVPKLQIAKDTGSCIVQFPFEVKLTPYDNTDRGTFRFCTVNGLNYGKLSKTKREKYFDFLNNDEISEIEKVVWQPTERDK